VKKAETSRFEPRYLRLRLPRVCVAVFGREASELLDKAEALAEREEQFLEFRLDYLAKPQAAIPALKQWIEQHRQVTLIGTCRRADNGGQFKGGVGAQFEILLQAAEAGFQIIDVEVETAEELKPAQFQALRDKTAILISSHDYKQTKNLEEAYQRILDSGPADIVKVISTARSLSDNITMMHLVQEHSQRIMMVGGCMGEQGIISRILTARAGSAFTFASGAEGEETAPGQIAARTLRSVYRIETIDPATKVYGVAADPVQHSLSPLMLNAALRRENVNAVYLPLHVKKMDDLLTCIRELPIHGISVTMPYKQEILEHLDKTDEITTKIGACNTVLRGSDGKLYGFNTDVAGVLRPLEQRVPLQGLRVLVLGAGGAARAAVFGLRGRGAEVCIYNRTAPTAQKLARQADAKTISRANLAKTPFDVIIHATPVGMDGKSALLEAKELNAKYLFEMVYSPAETPLVRMAREKGMQIIPGAEMFVHQGARQFEIWTAKPAPVDEMYRIVLHALARRAQQAAPKAAPGKQIETSVKQVATTPKHVETAAKHVATVARKLETSAKQSPPAKTARKAPAKPPAAKPAAKKPTHAKAAAKSKR
jgi:3-dehydroquinate dehydratase / shikimate dehydrogenase